MLAARACEWTCMSFSRLVLWRTTANIMESVLWNSRSPSLLMVVTCATSFSSSVRANFTALLWASIRRVSPPARARTLKDLGAENVRSNPDL
uniref:Dolichyl-phosphate-mannose-protein mannosyltransferase n=1 Tax=Vibrio harveyi TaxID=669 RepID=E5G5Q6_VIBHA|nr:dolichyl-phosphate-mannose-protein mannosyltransferase [Vibrio harveyi]